MELHYLSSIKNNDFFEQINVNKSTILSRRAIDINCPNSNDITVIAWSGINSGNEEISNMSKANIISDLQVSLKENNGIANIPSDLFYGQVTLHKNSSTKSTVSKRITNHSQNFNFPAFNKKD